MAIYDFKCVKCEKIIRDIHLPITHSDRELPMHCGEYTNYYITSPPQVIWTDPQIEPFRPVATPDAPIINNMREHRDYLARNDLVMCDDVYAPPTEAEERATNAETMATIDAITPNAEQQDMLERSGLDSIVD